MKNINGKVVFITGGSQGLGASISKRFADEGAKIAIFSIDTALDKKLEAELQSKTEVLFIKGDTRNSADIKNAMKIILARFGTLDFAINCAGVTGAMHPFVDMPENEYDFVMDVNVKGVFLCMQEELKIMLKNKSGKIVNIGSEATFTAGHPLRSVYCISKHALGGLTRNAAIAYADTGININAIAPGTMLTPLVAAFPQDQQDALANTRPTKRFVSIDSVASMAVYLCSDLANDMVGSIVNMDGGKTAM